MIYKACQAVDPQSQKKKDWKHYTDLSPGKGQCCLLLQTVGYFEKGDVLLPRTSTISQLLCTKKRTLNCTLKKNIQITIIQDATYRPDTGQISNPVMSLQLTTHRHTCIPPGYCISNYRHEFLSVHVNDMQLHSGLRRPSLFLQETYRISFQIQTLRGSNWSTVSHP